MKRTLYIIGTGGCAKEVAQVATAINEAGTARWAAIEYLAEEVGDVGRPMPFGRISGTDALLAAQPHPADAAVGVGDPVTRRAIARRLLALPHIATPNLVHPLAGLDPHWVQLGRGNLVARGAQFQCDIEVADFNFFSLNCTVGHDARIGSFNVVNPGCNISGAVHLGDACLLGTGSQLLEGLSLVSEVTVGAGAVVTRSIDAPGVHVGVPARARR